LILTLKLLSNLGDAMGPFQPVIGDYLHQAIAVSHFMDTLECADETSAGFSTLDIGVCLHHLLFSWHKILPLRHSA
jgi:hypothetical protein